MKNSELGSRVVKLEGTVAELKEELAELRKKVFFGDDVEKARHWLCAHPDMISFQPVSLAVDEVVRAAGVSKEAAAHALALEKNRLSTSNRGYQR